MFFLKKVLNLFRSFNRWLFIFILRAKGVNIGRSVKIESSALIEPSGGEISIGDQSFIDHGVVIRALHGRITIGENCYINAYSMLIGGGDISIGKNTAIAGFTLIVASNHVFESKIIPIREQGLITVGVKIGDDVWIGAGARILDGVSIGSGAVVGAGSVVTKDVPPNTIVAGVPSRVIGLR